MLVGDFNVWAEIADDADNVNLKTLISAYGLTQLVTEPTHEGGHTLEHVYVNEYQIQVNCKVVERFEISSDHFTLRRSSLETTNNVFLKISENEIEDLRPKTGPSEAMDFISKILL